MNAPEPPRRPTILKVLGILNIVLGSLGCICNCGGALGALIMPVMGHSMETMQRQYDAQRKSREQQFEDDLAAATDEDERKKIEDQRDQWRRKTPAMDFAAMYAWASDPRFVVHAVTDTVLSLVTNVLLILSGAGLLKLRPGARRLAQGTAIAKILINLAATAYTAIVLVPLQTEGMEKMMKQLETIQPASPMPPMMDFQKAAGVVGALANGIFVCAYPVALLIMLNLASVRRALAARPGA